MRLTSKEILEILKNKPHAFISAAQGTGNYYVNHKRLKEELKYAGLKFIEVGGYWGNTSEESFLIFGISFNDARKLALKYKQKAFIHNKNLYELHELNNGESYWSGKPVKTYTGKIHDLYGNTCWSVSKAFKIYTDEEAMNRPEYTVIPCTDKRDFYVSYEWV